ncbi:hypothetical protein HPB47_019893 [Ixodes persulcatus]|uniref:Uncharacterized protein n=1 Tax=Ixodes persulcatus TaxID=34615 RepID=A0AC60QH56_IXOPE|nr:hypothetical protein HPB47_019893 [Ixodes persulcatus]
METAAPVSSHPFKFTVTMIFAAVRELIRILPPASSFRKFLEAVLPLEGILYSRGVRIPAVESIRVLGNEEPHSAARGLIGRAGLTLDPSTTSLAGRDGLVTFRDVLDHYAGDRARYPPAHAGLDKASTVAWRRLQTDSYPSPSTLHKWYPDRYSPKCKLCGANANLRHMQWECARLDRSKHDPRYPRSPVKTTGTLSSRPPHRRSKKPWSDGPRTPPRSRGSKPPSEENDQRRPGKATPRGAADTNRLTLHLGK